MHIRYRKTFAAAWTALEKRLLPSYVWTSDPLTFWRERILFLICFIAAVFGPIALVPSLLLAYSEGLWIVILVDSLAYMAAVTILLARNVSFIVRALVICFILYALGTCLLFILGPGGAGYIWLFGASVLISTFVGLSAAIWTLVFNMIVMLSVGIFIAYGNPAWILHMDNALEKWLVMSTNFLLLNAFVTITTAFMLNGLKTAIIMEQKISKSLRENEDKFSTIFDKASDGILIADAITKKFLQGNATICSMLGYTKEEIVSLTVSDIHPPKDISHVLDEFEKQVRGETALAEGLPVLRKDRSIFYADIGTSTIIIGGVHYLVGIFRDITDRKQAEEVLWVLAARNEDILAAVPDIIMEVDSCKRYTWANQAGMKFFGDDVVGREASIYFEGEQETYNKVEPLFKGSKDVIYIESWQRRQDGEKRLLAWWCRVLKDKSGQVTGALSSALDITERKQAEEKLALHFEIQAAMNILLGLSLEGRPVKEFLHLALDLVLSLKWLAIESKGAIFLTDKAGETLHLQAQKGLSNELCAMCKTVPYGHCLCGRAAEARAVQFADRVDERHDTHYEGMPPHGHYCVPILSGDHVLGVIVLYVKEGHIRSPWEEDFLKAVANSLAGTIERKRAEEELQQTLERLRKSFGVTIQVMVSAIEVRDPYTAGHQKRVADLARSIATEMGLDRDIIEGIRMAGSIHDIGKLAIPSEILSKPSKLTNIEFSMIKEHSQNGYEMLKNVESSWSLAEIVYQHHERMNGSGYPRNLKGDDILIEARILAVADVVEAMASHRPYRPSLGIDAALAEIEKNKGTHYDNTVTDACLRLFREKGFKLEGT